MVEIKNVSELIPGDLVDLQGDFFADDGSHPEFEFEYQTVMEVVIESKNSVRVHFEHLVYGFPPEHLMRVENLS